MRRVLVLTEDALGDRMAGPAIRASRISEALSNAGHPVRLISTHGFREVGGNAPEVADHAQWAELIVLQGPLLTVYPFLGHPNKIVIMDAYVPAHLEDLETRRALDAPDRVEAAIDGVHSQLVALRRADFIMCASSRQRDLWLGHLAAIGRLNPVLYDRDVTLKSFVSIVPFGTEPGPPAATGNGFRHQFGLAASDKVLVWAGGVYEWFDPVTVVEAVNIARSEIPDIRLVFMGMRRPALAEVEGGVADRLRFRAHELGLVGSHVFFNDGWIPHEDRHNFLLDADVGVSAHMRNLETDFSFRTRNVDYLWAGLPIVATTGDAFAEIIGKTGCGVTAPPQDPGAFAGAVAQVLEPERRARASAAALEVADSFRWDHVLRPLVEFCRQPTPAPDRLDERTVRAVARLRGPEPTDPTWRQWVGTAKHHYEKGGVNLTARRVVNKIKRIFAPK